MVKNNYLLNIADIELLLEDGSKSFPLSYFNGFLKRLSLAKSRHWRIKKAASKKKANSVYFKEKLYIQDQKKQIFRISESRKNSRKDLLSDSRFISYAYAQILASNKGIMVHASCVVKNNQAYLFFGKSTDGKSTVAEISRDHKVIGDDVIVIRKLGNSYHAFATPWKQKTFIKADQYQHAKINAIFFLNKSACISFKELSMQEALIRIMYNHVHFLTFTRKDLAAKLFRLAEGLVRSVPAFQMDFKKKADFWSKLEEALE